MNDTEQKQFAPRLAGVSRDGITASGAKDAPTDAISPLAWLPKRLAALLAVSALLAYGFHVFGGWPLGILAIAVPIIGWGGLIVRLRRSFKRSTLDIGHASGHAEVTKIGNAMVRSRERLADQADMRRRFGL